MGHLLAGFTSELTKVAARAGLRLIRNLVEGGNLAKAERLALSPGVLKPSLAGSQIKQLGRGAEGVATLVAHPEHGVAVRKLYDPRGLATPELIKRKEIAGRVQSPHVADYHGSAPTPSGKTTMHFSQYVSPEGAHRAPLKGSPQERAGVRSTKAGTILHARQAGFQSAQDVRRGNMVWDGRTGRYKTIDYLPSNHGEFHQTLPGGQAVRVGGKVRSVPVGDSLVPTPRGDRLLQTGQPKTTVADLMRTHLAPDATPLASKPPPSIASGSDPTTRSLGGAPVFAEPPTRKITGGQAKKRTPRVLDPLNRDG